MRDYDPGLGNRGRHRWQNGGNVLIGQPVEAVSLQARFANLRWKRDEFCDLRMAGMKTRIKTGDLRHARQAFEDGIDGYEVVWLVQRGQRDELVKIGKCLPCQKHRLAVSSPAVNYTMSNTQHARAWPLRSQPQRKCLDGCMAISDAGIQAVAYKDCTLSILRVKPWRGANPLNATVGRV